MFIGVISAVITVIVLVVLIIFSLFIAAILAGFTFIGVLNLFNIFSPYLETILLLLNFILNIFVYKDLDAIIADLVRVLSRLTQGAETMLRNDLC